MTVGTGRCGVPPQRGWRATKCEPWRGLNLWNLPNISLFCRENQVLFIGKDFLDASVVVEIHVPVFVLFDKGVDVLPVIVCVPEFAEKLSKIVSFHYFFLNRGTAPEKRIESCPYLYIYTLF